MKTLLKFLGMAAVDPGYAALVLQHVWCWHLVRYGLQPIGYTTALALYMGLRVFAYDWNQYNSAFKAPGNNYVGQALGFAILHLLAWWAT